MTYDILVPINDYCPYLKKKYSPKITYSVEDSDLLNIPCDKDPIGLHCKEDKCDIAPCPILQKAPDTLTYAQIQDLLNK